MNFIAVLDYEHLDNGVFLTAFAQSLSQQKGGRGIIIHKDSAYTERLIQTGIMRDEAVVRAARDLNHRLVALFADHGISTIGLNGYQRSIFQLDRDRLTVDKKQLERLPSTPHLLISSLAIEVSSGQRTDVSLQLLATSLSRQLGVDDLLLFSLDDSGEIIEHNYPDRVHPEDPARRPLLETVPKEFRNAGVRARLLSARTFSNYPKTEGTVLIDPTFRE